MAETYIDLLTVGITTSTAIAAGQPVTSTGGAATAAGSCLGIAKTAIASGAYGPVQVAGVALCVAGGAITAGDYVKVGSTVTQVVTQGGTGTIIGVALNATSNAGDAVRVLLKTAN